MKKLLLIVFLLVGCASDKTPSEKIESYLNSKSYELLETSYGNVVSFESESEVGSIWFTDSGELFKTVKAEKLYKKAVDVETMADDESTIVALYILEEDIYLEAEYALITFADKSIEPVRIELGDEYKKVWVYKLDECITSCALDKIELFQNDELTYVEAFIPT